MTQYLIKLIREITLLSSAGLLPRARILVSQEGDYELHILLKTTYSESALNKVAVT